MENQEKTERNSNFELLRIVLMFSIIMYHFVGLPSNALKIISAGGGGKLLYFAMILGHMGRIAVSSFIMLGAWYMADLKFKASRVLNLYIQTISYTVTITLFLIATGQNVSIKNILISVFPFYGFALWFISAYMWLILVSPFLQKLLDWDRDNLKKLIIVLTFMIPVYFTIHFSKTNLLNAVLYFMYVFLCIGYYKKYLINKIKFNPKIFLTLGLMLYITIVSIKFYAFSNNLTIVSKISNAYLNNFITIPNIIIAFSIFYYFSKLDIGKNKIINTIAKPTLAVYIIHQAPGIFSYLWYNILKSEYFLSQNYAILYIISIPFILYAAAMITEFIRKNIPKMFNIKRLKFICVLENKIDDFYKGTITKETNA